MILSFFCAVSVGKFVSGFNSEWQRQFIPYLFFIAPNATGTSGHMSLTSNT